MAFAIGMSYFPTPFSSSNHLVLALIELIFSNSEYNDSRTTMSNWNEAGKQWLRYLASGSAFTTNISGNYLLA